MFRSSRAAERGRAAAAAAFALVCCVAASGQNVPPLPFQLSACLPHDVFAPIPGATGFQSPMDSMSWQMFVALNWPASQVENGVPDRSLVIGGQPVGGYYPNGMRKSPTVWETYKDSNDVFLPNGAPPSPFSAPTSHLLFDDTVPFTNSSLVDQNGNSVYYEIRMNEVEYDFIVNNKLYLAANQKGIIIFPSGSNDRKSVGSIHVKAAWKIMGPSDDQTRFYTANATIVKSGVKTLAKVGLVGLHISHKTRSRPQWIWSTFEQVDNCPDLPASGPIPAGKYNFCNANCPVTKCIPNQQTPQGSTTPTQVLRVTPISDSTKNLNKQWQQALRSWNSKNVWQYYQLVSTQWPANPPDTKNFGDPQPQFLANTTLETYFQGPTQGSPPHSCIGCHGQYAVSKDFNFQLYKAYSPTPKPEPVPGFFNPPRPQ